MLIQGDSIVIMLDIITIGNDDTVMGYEGAAIRLEQITPDLL